MYNGIVGCIWGGASVSYGIWGSLVILVLVGVYAYTHYHGRDPNQRGILCDHSEDRGFYEDLGPESLPAYQDALNEIFYWLDVQHFEGSTIPRSLRVPLNELMGVISTDPRLNLKYLRVMLAQYLQTDSGVRRQGNLAANWAETVVAIDRTGGHGGAPKIPSAWKVYFKNSLQEELQPQAANAKN